MHSARSPHPRLLVAIAGAASFAATFDAYFVNLAISSIADEFGSRSVADVSWVLTASTIVFAALVVPAGRFSDLLGVRRSFVAGLAVFAAASAAAAAAPSLEALIAARLAQGAGAAIVLPTSVALLITNLDGAVRARALALWTAAGAGASAAGPGLGGVLTSASWRLGFVVSIPFCLFAATAAWRTIGATPPRRERRPDLAGSVLLALALAGATTAIVKGGAWGWTSPKTLAAAFGALALGGGFLGRSSRHAAPVLELGLVRHRQFAAAMTATSLLFFAFSAWLLSSVFLFTHVWDYSSARIGATIIPASLIGAAFAVVSGRLVPRFGAARLATAGPIVAALGCAWWLVNADPASGYVVAALPAIVLVGTGMGIATPALIAAATASLPGARAATGSASLQMTRQIGWVLGIAATLAVLGASADASLTTGRLSVVWIGAAIALLGAAVAARALTPRAPRRRTVVLRVAAAAARA